MDSERLGLAWAGASKDDVEKANQQVWRKSGKRLARLHRLQAMRQRIAREDEGETLREIVERYRRYD